jgi:hypothetical protein
VALGTFIAGAYTATWNAVSVGLAEDGFELEFQAKLEAIDQSDQYAKTTLDLIFQGVDGFISATLLEWKTGAITVMWPWGGASLGKIISAAMPIGFLASDQAQAFVMTSTASTPAAAAPATLTASKTFLAENYNPRILVSSKLRKIPIRLRMLPTTSTGTILFSTT